MDGKSGMMKYQTGSHDDIISFILNGRGKSVYWNKKSLATQNLVDILFIIKIPVLKID